MATSYKQVDIVCPYYKGDDGHCKVWCEGVVDGSVITQTYKSKKDYLIQVDVFCCKRYVNCEIYKMLEDKYK